jgi:hypothetical protein
MTGSSTRDAIAICVIGSGSRGLSELLDPARRTGAADAPDGWALRGYRDHGDKRDDGGFR